MMLPSAACHQPSGPFSGAQDFLKLATVSDELPLLFDCRLGSFVVAQGEVFLMPALRRQIRACVSMRVIIWFDLSWS